MTVTGDGVQQNTAHGCQATGVQYNTAAAWLPSHWVQHNTAHGCQAIGSIPAESWLMQRILSTFVHVHVINYSLNSFLATMNIIFNGKRQKKKNGGSVRCHSMSRAAVRSSSCERTENAATI